MRTKRLKILGSYLRTNKPSGASARSPLHHSNALLFASVAVRDQHSVPPTLPVSRILSDSVSHPDIRPDNGNSSMIISTVSTCSYNVELLSYLCYPARPVSIIMALQCLCYTKPATSTTGSPSQVHHWKPLWYTKRTNIACTDKVERNIWLVESVAFF
jgi:hypothetical protein